VLRTPKAPRQLPGPSATASTPSPAPSAARATGTPAAPRKRWRRASLWAAVALVAGLSLTIGAGAFSAGRSKPPSLYQRTLEVAGEYRCPVCASESAAVSDAAEAVEIRSLIEGWLKQGKSQAQIREYLVSDYGDSILEKPPASGLDTLVWVLPAIAAALGVVGLGFGFARWRRLSAPARARPAAGSVVGPVAGPEVGGAAARAPGSAPGLAGLSAETAVQSQPVDPVQSVQSAPPVQAIEPVQQSLFDAGGEDQPVEASPGTGGPLGHPPAPRPLYRRLLYRRLLYRRLLYRRPPYEGPLYRRVAPVLGAVLILVAGALWLVDRSSSQRLPGGTVSGGVTGVDEQLQQAAVLATSDPAGALAIYDQVLASDPDQPVALSAEGWIYAAAGYVAKGEDLLQKAEADDPSYDPPHLYRGLVLLDDERKPVAAIKELKWYLAHGPDPTMAKTARTALAQAEASL
jgi:cytochrome c-type biogenesis protein CcmH